MLISGDLRPLFVLWLCNAVSLSDGSNESKEPHVPHGLANLQDKVADLLAFFEAEPFLVDVAAAGIPAFNAQRSQSKAVNTWLTKLTDVCRDKIIQRLLSEDPIALNAE